MDSEFVSVPTLSDAALPSGAECAAADIQFEKTWVQAHVQYLALPGDTSMWIIHWSRLPTDSRYVAKAGKRGRNSIVSPRAVAISGLEGVSSDDSSNPESNANETMAMDTLLPNQPTGGGKCPMMISQPPSSSGSLMEFTKHNPHESKLAAGAFLPRIPSRVPTAAHNDLAFQPSSRIPTAMSNNIGLDSHKPSRANVLQQATLDAMHKHRQPLESLPAHGRLSDQELENSSQSADEDAVQLASGGGTPPRPNLTIVAPTLRSSLKQLNVSSPRKDVSLALAGNEDPLQPLVRPDAGMMTPNANTRLLEFGPTLGSDRGSQASSSKTTARKLQGRLRRAISNSAHSLIRGLVWLRAVGILNTIITTALSISISVYVSEQFAMYQDVLDACHSAQQLLVRSADVTQNIRYLTLCNREWLHCDELDVDQRRSSIKSDAVALTLQHRQLYVLSKSIGYESSYEEHSVAVNVYEFNPSQNAYAQEVKHSSLLESVLHLAAVAEQIAVTPLGNISRGDPNVEFVIANAFKGGPIHDTVNATIIQ
jgi:hypothetical protein